MTRLALWSCSSTPQQSKVLQFLKTFIRVVLITAKEFQGNELSLRSSALTYTILLSLVPMLAMSTAVVKGLGGGNQLRQVISSYILTLDESTTSVSTEETASQQQTEETKDAPSSKLTDHLQSATDKLFDYVDRTNFATLGTIGVLGIFVSVLLVLSNIETSMNIIWHVENGRSLIRKISDYLTLVILMPISINVGFAASAVLKNPTLFSKLESLLPVIWIQAVILELIPILFITLTLYVIYLFFPNTKVKTLPALTGALFAGFFWFKAQNIYITLQVGVAKYNAIYGSFATVPLFLIWIFFGWVFILAGAQIAYACQNRDSYELVPAVHPPAESLSAAFDIVLQVSEAFNESRPCTGNTVQEKLQEYPPSLISQTIRELIDGDILRITEPQGLLLPAVPPEKVQHKEIVTAILGTSSLPTAGGQRCREVLVGAE